MLGIDSFLKTPVRRMSGGMKKRLSIGCAVVSHPGILVLSVSSIPPCSTVRDLEFQVSHADFALRPLLLRFRNSSHTVPPPRQKDAGAGTIGGSA